MMRKEATLNLRIPRTGIFFRDGLDVHFKLNGADQERLSTIPFNDKLPLRRGRPRVASILYGPHGSGRSYLGNRLYSGLALEDKPSWIVASNDAEIGYPGSSSIKNIPQYRKHLQSPLGIFGTTNNARRIEAYRKFGSDAQRICSLTLDIGVANGFNMLVDLAYSSHATPSSSRVLTTSHVLSTFKENDYATHVHAIVGPLGRALEFFDKNARPYSKDGLFTSRIQTLRDLTDVMNAADEFSLYWNPTLASQPVVVLKKTSNGIDIDPTLFDDFCDGIRNDADHYPHPHKPGAPYSRAVYTRLANAYISHIYSMHSRREISDKHDLAPSLVLG
jgi:hypothetical protein